MKALFKEIRAGDVEAVSMRLDNDSALANAIAKAPPKTDAGESALQVAIKSANFPIAHLLLDHGADVNYMDRSPEHGWTIPVLHMAIRAAVFSARYGRNRALPGEPARIEIMNSADEFERAFGVLSVMVARGADLTTSDSAGNLAIGRAVLDARQVIDEPILDDLAGDLGRVFTLLFDAGADPHWVDPRRGEPLSTIYASEPVVRFLDG